MNRFTLAVLTAAALAATATTALAQPPAAAPAAAPAPPTPAQQFATQVGQFNTFEQLAGQLVILYGRNAAVKDFAATLVTEHGRAQADFAAAAAAAGVTTTSPGLSPAQTALLDALRNAPAAQIDGLFVTQQIQAHTDGLALLNGPSGGNAALGTAAQKTAALVQARVARLQALPR